MAGRGRPVHHHLRGERGLPAASGPRRKEGDFIESFWRKRDPDPSTPDNEVKLEYYKRIAQANKLFSTSGLAGWRTDRGRIYILLGPPKEVQRDFGGQGSGLSAFTGPKETWQYWNLPNPKLPYNMEFVFVDRFGTGSYVLDRSFRTDRGRNDAPRPADVTFQFDAMENLSEALKNPFENLGNLKGVITAEVDYDLVPFRWEVFAFKGAPEKGPICPCSSRSRTPRCRSKKGTRSISSRSISR